MHYDAACVTSQGRDVDHAWRARADLVTTRCAVAAAPAQASLWALLCSPHGVVQMYYSMLAGSPCGMASWHGIAARTPRHSTETFGQWRHPLPFPRLQLADCIFATRQRAYLKTWCRK